MLLFFSFLFLCPRHPQLKKPKEMHELPRHFSPPFTLRSGSSCGLFSFFFMLCFVVETREKRLMNRSTAPAVSALTDKHWRHSEMHKNLKDGGDELKASSWLKFPVSQCFDESKASQKLRHDQDANHESAWEEIVDEYFPLQMSDSCTVGLFSHLSN